MGPLSGCARRRGGRDRPGPVLRHAPRRPRRGGGPGRSIGGGRRPRRRPGSTCSTGAAGRSAVDLKHDGGTGGRAPARRAGRRAARGVPARRGRAPRHRPGAVPGAQPPPRLRADDRLGPGRPARRRAPATTSPTPPWRARWPTSVAPTSSPTPPLNLVADFGGGGMLLALGLVAGLLHARSARVRARWSTPRWSTARPCSWRRSSAPSAIGFWSDERGTNLLDSGAPFYDVYRCADGEEIAVGAIEPQFFAALLDVLGLDAAVAARPERPGPVAGAPGRAHLGVRAASPDRVADRAEGRGRLPRARADHGRGGRAPAHPGPAARSSSGTGCPSRHRRPRFSATPTELDRPPGRPWRAHRRGAAGLGFRRWTRSTRSAPRAPSPERRGGLGPLASRI